MSLILLREVLQESDLAVWAKVPQDVRLVCIFRL